MVGDHSTPLPSERWDEQAFSVGGEGGGRDESPTQGERRLELKCK